MPLGWWKKKKTQEIINFLLFFFWRNGCLRGGGLKGNITCPHRYDSLRSAFIIKRRHGAYTAARVVKFARSFFVRARRPVLPGERSAVARPTRLYTTRAAAAAADLACPSSPRASHGRSRRSPVVVCRSPFAYPRRRRNSKTRHFRYYPVGFVSLVPR